MNPLAPEMTGEAIDWGEKVVTHLTKRMLSIEAVTFKKLIVTLEMSDLIESEIGEYGKVTYSLMAA